MLERPILLLQLEVERGPRKSTRKKHKDPREFHRHGISCLENNRLPKCDLNMCSNGSLNGDCLFSPRFYVFRGREGLKHKGEEM